MGQSGRSVVDSKTPAIVPGRACGNCTLCCKVMVVEELAKPAGTWCPNCTVGKGCSIYDERPATCRGFLCGYLIGPQLTEIWRPTRAKIVLALDDRSRSITAYVDPGSPTAWRNEPYYSDLKRWSREFAAVQGNVFVAVGRRVIVVLPQGGETDLGIVAEDERILTRELPSFSGKQFEAIKIKKDDPRASGQGVGRNAAFMPRPL
jgi:hypothetical protein